MSAPDLPAFRQVLGRFATGVVVVAAVDGGEPHGLAVNSFTSVSLDPPLVGFCAAHTSGTWPHLRRAGRFAVSILGGSQEEVCQVFARKGADRFGSLAWSLSPGGQPLLDGALAWLDCELHAIHPAGDHDLVLGEVTALGDAGGEDPLVFFRGRFARLGVSTPAGGTGTRAPDELGRLHGLDVDSPFFAVLAARIDAR